MSDERKDGGQAFPQSVTVGPNDDLYPAYPGMTLRDYFAGQALAGMLSNGFQPKEAFKKNGPGARTEYGPDTYVAMAYRLADDMLAERSK